tara:strand:- start:281 stop:484 length:204 start_codon:yes stop_codon:yes gene_type:complete
MNTDEKLDLLLEKIIDIDNRLKKIENQTEEIHHYVPFVGWLEEQGQKLAKSKYLSYFIPKTIENKEN